jgi:epoxyqueuosine reductase
VGISRFAQEYVQPLNGRIVRELAAECGFPLAGVTSVKTPVDFGRFRDWADRGLAGEMHYLTDHRGDLRATPAELLPGARSIICTGFPYNGPEPYSTEFSDPELGWIARYAWGEDYHKTLRQALQLLADKLLKIEQFSWRACVDTAPLLERSLAHAAGLGWIGRNTCLINQQQGSWFFLGELLTTLDLPADSPAPDRCGSCTRCIDACPTEALIPAPGGGYELDSRLCISYFTIELRDRIPEPQRALTGNNLFGCDICQDVCPWNRKAPRLRANETAFAAPPLERFAELDETGFRNLFRGTPVTRAKYRGFVRNVAVAMGNSGLAKFRAPLEKMADSDDSLIAEHARWALTKLPAPFDLTRCATSHSSS